MNLSFSCGWSSIEAANFMLPPLLDGRTNDDQIMPWMGVGN